MGRTETHTHTHLFGAKAFARALELGLIAPRAQLTDGLAQSDLALSARREIAQGRRVLREKGRGMERGVQEGVRNQGAGRMRVRENAKRAQGIKWQRNTSNHSGQNTEI